MTAARDVAIHLKERMQVLWPSAAWKFDEAGANIFQGPPQPIKPVLAIFVVGVSSPDAVFLKDGGTLESKRVKVYFRIPAQESSAGGYVLGEQIAEMVLAAIDRDPPTGYYEAKSLSSTMQLMEADPQGHLLWVCDFIVERRTVANKLKYYAGASALSLTTEADILANLLAISINGFPTQTPIMVATGEHAYIVVEDSFGITTFVVNGFPGGWVDVGNVTVAGKACTIWKTPYTGFGLINVVIS